MSAVELAESLDLASYVEIKPSSGFQGRLHRVLRMCSKDDKLMKAVVNVLCRKVSETSKDRRNCHRTAEFILIILELSEKAGYSREELIKRLDLKEEEFKKLVEIEGQPKIVLRAD